MAPRKGRQRTISAPAEVRQRREGRERRGSVCGAGARVLWSEAGRHYIASSVTGRSTSRARGPTPTSGKVQPVSLVQLVLLLGRAIGSCSPTAISIFFKKQITEIYFSFHILQFYTPTARQESGRDLYINKYKFYLRRGLWRGPTAPLPGGRPPAAKWWGGRGPAARQGGGRLPPRI